MLSISSKSTKHGKITELFLNITSIMLKNILTIAFLLLSPAAAFSQFATIETYGTKAVGTGTCITSVKDINSVYGNVAGLAFSRNLEANLAFENRFEVFDLSVISFGLSKNFNKVGVFGISIKRFGISEYNEFNAAFSYARKLTEELSVGIRFNTYSLVIEGYGNRFGYNADVGIQYDLNDKLILGFFLANPFPIKFIDNIKLPTFVHFGLKYKVSDNLIVYTEVEKHIDHNYMIKGGLEILLLDKISIYGGYRNDLDRFSDFSIGIGYELTPNIILDIATQYHLALGISPSMSVSYFME